MIKSDCVSCGAQILNIAYPYVASPKSSQVASSTTGDIRCSTKLEVLMLSTNCVIDLPHEPKYCNKVSEILTR